MTYDPRDHVIVSLTGETLEKVKEEIDESIDLGARCVELKGDRIKEFRQSVFDSSSLRNILLYRFDELPRRFISFRKSDTKNGVNGYGIEGFALTEPKVENQRMEYIHHAMTLARGREKDFVFDVEVESLNALKEKGIPTGVKVMGSEHNYVETPGFSYLVEIHGRMTTFKGLWGIKYVPTAHWADDLVNLFVFNAFHRGSDKRDLRLIGHARGEIGKMSRILSLSYGSDYTYAGLDNKRISDEGQMSFEETLNQLRFVKDWPLKRAGTLHELDVVKSAQRMGMSVPMPEEE